MDATDSVGAVHRAMVEPHSLGGRVDWDAVEAEAAGLLSRYVRVDSAHPVASTVGTVGFLEGVLGAEGIETRRYPAGVEGKINLVARLRADDRARRGKALVLSNHMDTVQAVAADWTFDPYSGAIEDGHVYGRGTLDMKGMGVMEVMTLLLLQRLGARLTRDVVLLCTCDEEVGSALGAQFMVENHLADLDPAFVLDEGGSGLKGFFSAGDVFEVSVDEKRSVKLRLVARAEPGHASQPWAESATHRLVRAAGRLLSAPPEDRDCPPVAEMIRRLGGEGARREMASTRATGPLLHDTVALTMMQGGYKINVIPEQAEMSFDCRLLPDTDERAFVSNVEQIMNDPAIRVEAVLPNAASTPVPWDSEPFRAIEAACLAHAPGSIVTPSICVGGTDARYFRQAGVPAYGLVPCLFTADDLKGYHGIDERLSLKNVRLGTRIVFDIAARFATG